VIIGELMMVEMGELLSRNDYGMYLLLVSFCTIVFIAIVVTCDPFPQLHGAVRTNWVAMLVLIVAGGIAGVYSEKGINWVLYNVEIDKDEYNELVWGNGDIPIENRLIVGEQVTLWLADKNYVSRVEYAILVEYIDDTLAWVEESEDRHLEALEIEEKEKQRDSLVRQLKGNS